MEIENLYYYLKVADTLSFRKAAEELFISQSTLSRQIMSMEKELGVSLFDRTTRSVSLTEAGVACAEYAEKIIKNYEELKVKASGLAGNRSGEIKIGFYGHDTMYYISIMFEHMKRAYPGLSLKVHDEQVYILEEKLKDGNYDVLVLLKPCISDSRVVKKTISHEVPSVILRDDHPYAGKKIVSIADLRDEVFLAMKPGKKFSTYDELVKLCRENGFEPKTENHVGYNKSLWVAMGKGIVLDPFMADDDNVLPGLKRIPVECDDRFDRQIMYMCDNSNPMMPLFLAEIEKMVARDMFRNKLIPEESQKTE